MSHKHTHTHTQTCTQSVNCSENLESVSEYVYKLVDQSARKYVCPFVCVCVCVRVCVYEPAGRGVPHSAVGFSATLSSHQQAAPWSFSEENTHTHTHTVQHRTLFQETHPLPPSLLIHSGPSDTHTHTHTHLDVLWPLLLLSLSLDALLDALHGVMACGLALCRLRPFRGRCLQSGAKALGQSVAARPCLRGQLRLQTLPGIWGGERERGRQGSVCAFD